MPTSRKLQTPTNQFETLENADYSETKLVLDSDSLDQILLLFETLETQIIQKQNWFYWISIC
jgi:hypothetical protein